MAKEIEEKIYAIVGVDTDLVVPIERDPDAEVPDLAAEAEASAEEPTAEAA